MKKILLDYKDWLFNTQAPIFDKICAVFVTVVILGLFLFVLFGLFLALVTNPAHTILGLGILFFAVSVLYLNLKYIA